MDKHIMLYPHKEILLSNQKKKKQKLIVKYPTTVIHCIFQFIGHSRIVVLNYGDRNQKSDCFMCVAKVV